MMVTDVMNTGVVALRKESVDRNSKALAPSLTPKVALRKESVDRNWRAVASFTLIFCRSPQGERG